MMRNWAEDYQLKVIHPSNLEKKAQEIRQTGATIATLNGSFDLLHAGHLHILYEASQVADCLIVALNSDTSIKQYKGPDRPIIALPQRLQLLSALQFVNYVTWFDETDPREVLKKIKPHVHVNGEEYGSNCIEADTVKELGATLHLVKRLPGLATSQLLKTMSLKCD